jgi:hypothetical protein
MFSKDLDTIATSKFSITTFMIRRTREKMIQTTAGAALSS